MDLTNFHTLATNEKLAVLRTSAGLQWLEELLSEGNTLSKISEIIGVKPSILYKWKKNSPDIQEAVAPYLRAKTQKIETIDLSKPLAYRIIYAYDDLRPSIRGYIMAEYDSQDDLWDSIFVQQYFGSFALYSVSDAKYREEYLVAMRTTGVYKLSNWYILAYCSVNKRGKIIPHKYPI
jgi:hypothetical protein